MTDRYDNDFRFHAQSHNLDWLNLKAQAIAESSLDPDAVSKAGAMGITQFMPATWKWIWREVIHFDGVIPSPFEPAASIEAQAIYIGILLLKFGDWRQAFAAYNWGPARVKRVVNLYGVDWYLHLPQETEQYLYAIERAREGLA